VSGSDTNNLVRITPGVAVLAALAVCLGVVLVSAFNTVFEAPVASSTRVEQTPDATLGGRGGVGNPVTAVLLDYRAYDTLLELGVLVLAVLGVQAAIGSVGKDPLPHGGDHDLLLAAAVGVVVPVAIVVAGNLLWMGTDSPGGAFQAGAVLSGAGIMLVLARRLRVETQPDWRWRLAIVVGVGLFSIVGVALLFTGGQLLEYPPKLAKSLILAIETAAMASVATVFVYLFAVVARPQSSQSLSNDIDSEENQL